MKKLFLTLVAISVLFVIGCQESAITDPLSTDSPGIQNVTNGTAVKDITQAVPTIIRFENELATPYPSSVPGEECFLVAGTIEVDHKVWQLDPVPQRPQYRVTVKLCINAEMSCTTGQWPIGCETENTIYFLGAEAFTLTKYYPVAQRSDQMKLVVDYEVSIDGVALKGMELELPRYRVDKVVNSL